ncbi:dATP pyrophosphohydrolase [Escherichia coli]|uniref:dATP pyrophosphohydrolase n=1 Tax=Escherichia coli TaxID=562 RepID=A0A376KUA5_ECOLX|nr:dATP pyrophosphohydrolase [Escherichia coli]
MAYKRPVSILVVIYAQDTKRVLMLQRRDDPDFLAVGNRQRGRGGNRAASCRARSKGKRSPLMLSLNN